MSSSSHKRQKLSQKQVREAYEGQLASSQSVASAREDFDAGIAETNNTPASQQTHSSSTPGIASFRPHSSVAAGGIDAIGANVPYETPLANRQAQQPQSRNLIRSEPSTFLDSAAASSLSTLPSDRTQPTRRVQMVTFPPLSSHDPCRLPSSTNEVDGEPQIQNQAPRGVSSASFNLWHRRDSFGHIEFGTQSSPPKPLSNLRMSVDSTTNEEPQGSNNPTTASSRTQYTVPTAVAPPDSNFPSAPATDDPSPNQVQEPITTSKLLAKLDRW